MTFDHKKNHVAASAAFCVRSSLGAVFGPVLLCCGLVGATLAHADEGEGQQRDDGRAPQGQREFQRDSQRDTLRDTSRDAPRERPAAQPRQSDARALDPRGYEARAEEQRRAMQEASRNAEISRSVGRLTPDERRDLRRQINEVGQDLYSTPPRR